MRAALALLAAAVPLVGVMQYGGTREHGLHDPVHALQQLDLLYLDEPAPLAAELGLRRGAVSLVVVCAGPSVDGDCPLPVVAGADVVRTADPAVAAAYGLRGLTGYALVDPDLQVRYRSVDPDVADHAEELRVLVRGVR